MSVAWPQPAPSKQVADRPPVTEIGITNPYPLPSWAQFGSTRGGPFVDYLEHVPELRWPTSVRSTYPRMASDTQLKALMRGTVLPITRYQWMIDPNGADGTIVANTAEDLNLPILGQDGGHTLRSQNRFSFKKHQLDAFRALEYGHYFFEQVGDIAAISEGGDGLWHLRKLAARPPRTIGQIFVEQDGGLAEIRQYVGFWSPGIPVGNLVAYVWDQEPGNWVGMSMFRACYREWLIKDRLLRVDAINHEKSGGQWWAEGPVGAQQSELDALGAQVAQIRVGETSGMAVPNGAALHLERAHSVSTAIQSINRHDEAMARAFLMMFISLGQTQTGSRAVGETFTDFAGVFREAIALWFADVFNDHVIEDAVDWNYGSDVRLVPRLTFDTGAADATDSALDEFAGASFDPAVQAAIAGKPRWQVERIRAQYDREQRAIRARVDRLIPALIEATAEAELDPAGNVVTTREQVIEQELQYLEDTTNDDDMVIERLLETVTRKPLRTAASALLPAPDDPAAVSLPDRKVRDLFPHEVAAKVDFAAIDRNWQSQATSLVNEWKTVRAIQIEQLRAAVVAAGGNLTELSSITADVAGADTIAARLKTMAQLGAAEAAAEAGRQGATATVPVVTDLEAQLEARAAGLAQLLASALSQAAATKAFQLSGGALTADEVAGQVVDYLNGLSDSYLTDQFGGALSAAQNAGRVAAMRTNNATRWYASELLDANTCDPCAAEDGTEFDTLEDAVSAYPAGGYSGCLGGPRCRGTIVATYTEQTGGEL